MIEDFRRLLEKYTVSDETGMVVCRSFDPSMLLGYAKRCRLERVSYEDALNAARSAGLEIVMDGQGLIGAVAAVPYFADSDRSVVPEWLCEEH
jgi:tRNA(Ile2) C34 agmatinyltransferase TiaS